LNALHAISPVLGLVAPAGYQRGGHDASEARRSQKESRIAATCCRYSEYAKGATLARLGDVY
jgi:hypothetical protein